MELRALEATNAAQDLTPPIWPLAAALHDAFLSSHCSSCFRQLPSQNASPVPHSFPSYISCPACNSSIFYCSLACSASDLPRHISSGECRLLSTWRQAANSDVRASLRLLHSVGLDPVSDQSNSSTRIAGLLASDLEGVLKEGGEIAEVVIEGAALMTRARSEKQVGEDGCVAVAKVALWAVLTNAVEVQAGETGPIGIAVYGPMFSWFNHSCSPNACYRFEFGFGSSEPCSLLVFAAGSDHEASACKAWFYSENQLPSGLCGYGPRVVVRCIKPIKKDEEVCIAYGDLLQPKAARKAELWSKFRFVCGCDRCCASLTNSIDYVLSCDLRNLNLGHSHEDMVSEEFADFLDQTIEEYLYEGKPQVCCEKIESMLSGRFGEKQLQAEKASLNKFMLHPLHHLSLKAYITLASAYKVCASHPIEANVMDFKASRAAAANALLLAGATQHLLMSETSLVANAALFWIQAGEYLLHLVRSLKWRSAKPVDASERTSDLLQFHWIKEVNSSVSWDQFHETAIRFFKCVLLILPRCWPFLVEGFSFLENIKNPIDFSWLGLPKIPPCFLPSGSLQASKHLFSECQLKVEVNVEQVRLDLFQVSTLCVLYGRYLASICYGSQGYLAEHARRLLEDFNLDQ